MALDSVPNTPTLFQHLRELESSLLQPNIRQSERLPELLAEDFLEFGSSGRTYTKADVVATLAAEQPSRYTASDFKVVELGAEAALVTYRVHLHRDPVVQTLRSSVWHCRAGQWQMVFHQATIVAQT